MSCASATTPNITHACSLFTKSAVPLATPRSTKRVASGSATLLRQRQALKLPTQRNDLDKPRTIDLHTGAPPPTKLSFGTARLQYDCSLTFYLEGFGSIFYFTIYGHHQLIRDDVVPYIGRPLQRNKSIYNKSTRYSGLTHRPRLAPVM